jgi:hypothetical protein
MTLYALCISEFESPHKEWFIEFYWADDDEHAQEQAENAHPGGTILAAATVPYGPRLPSFPA